MVLAYEAPFLALVDVLLASAPRPVKPPPWSETALDAAQARANAKTAEICADMRANRAAWAAGTACRRLNFAVVKKFNDYDQGA